jgi:hypothetical protein
MPSRGEVKRWKPKRADGWALCDAITEGHCTCRQNQRGPCTAWAETLQECYAFGIADPVAAERLRIEVNTSEGVIDRSLSQSRGAVMTIKAKSRRSA